MADQLFGTEALPYDLRPPTSRLHRVEYVVVDDDDSDADVPTAGSDSEDDEDADLEAEEEPLPTSYNLVNDGDSFSDTATNVSGSVSSRLSRMSQPVEGDDDDFADAIAPLRTTADRVSLQIDLFAKAVAEFKEQSLKGDRKATLDCAINLIRGFQKIADSMASPSRGNDALKKARSMVGAANPSTIDENVIRAKLESDTWDLFSQLLVVDNMELDPELLRQMKEEPLGELHRFSSEYDIWKRFLEIDIFSASTATVMRWLEKTSRSLVHAAIDTTIADLEAKAGMNSGGIWTQGWLASREKVKGGKRLYGRTTLLEPDDVALRPQLNTGKYVETITHLDPDAAIRQDRPLMERDQYLEQASWLTIWKMLRQGRSWPEIKDWASERLEYWRAVSICGSSVGCGSDDVDPFDESFTRMMNCDSLDVWRSACRSLANRPTDEFERAVYALLCGETEPAYKACQGWSDYLYVYLNSLLISRYRDFYSQHQQFIDYPKDQPFHFYLKEPYYEKLRTYIDSLKTNDKFKAEARNPYRTVQSAVISRPYDEFFQRQSNALSKVAASSKGRTLVPRFYDSDVDDGAFVTAQDESGIRMICHFYIITKGLNQVTNSEQVTEHASVNIIGYINLLQRMKKLEHIPLYASLLHEATCYNVLGRVLVYVTDEKQRLSLIRAVEKQGLDMAKVLDSQWQYLVSETLEQDGFLKPIQIKRTVVRPKDGLPPKIISSKNNFINKHVRKDSEALIKSLEWHSYVKGTWNKVCVFGKFLYKRFFTAGRLTEARLLHERVPLTRLSLDILGRDITSSLEYLEFTNEEGDATPTQERPETHLTQRQLEYLQSQTMRDLEMLIEVFEALDEWNALVEKLEKADSNTNMAELVRSVRPSLDNITTKIHLVVADDWLDNPEDEHEKTELDFIRTTYLPEVVLQYHHALYTAGQAFYPDALIECMNVSASISGTPNVLKAFISAGRMRELADALAVSSLALLEHSSKEGGQRKRLAHGATMDIWRVTKKPKTAAEA